MKKIAVSWECKRAAERRKAVVDVQVQLAAPNIDPDTRAQLRQTLTVLNEQGRMDKAIRAALSYQYAGDRPTSHFYSTGCSAKSPSSIKAIKLGDGLVTTDQASMEEDLCRF